MFYKDFRAPDLKALDLQIRRLEEQVEHLDLHLGEMCSLFSGYVRKTRAVGDKADRLVREITAYADAQTPLSLQHRIKRFAGHLAQVQDVRHASVDRLDVCVVEPLKRYGAFMRRNREALGATRCARERVAKQEARLRLRLDVDPQKVELKAATVEVARSARELKDTIEETRVKDVKRILCDFATAEMSFHAKALELYTLAYRRLQGADEEDHDGDLEMFRSFLNPQGLGPASQRLHHRQRPGSSYLRGGASLRPSDEEDGDSGTSQHCTKSYLMKSRFWFPEQTQEDDDDDDEEEEDDKHMRDKYKGVEGDVEDDE